MNTELIHCVFREFIAYSGYLLRIHNEYAGSQWIRALCNEYAAYSLRIQWIRGLFIAYSMNTRLIHCVFNEYATYSLRIFCKSNEYGAHSLRILRIHCVFIADSLRIHCVFPPCVFIAGASTWQYAVSNRPPLCVHRRPLTSVSRIYPVTLKR